MPSRRLHLPFFWLLPVLKKMSSVGSLTDNIMASSASGTAAWSQIDRSLHQADPSSPPSENTSDFHSPALQRWLTETPGQSPFHNLGYVRASGPGGMPPHFGGPAPSNAGATRAERDST